MNSPAMKQKSLNPKPKTLNPKFPTPRGYNRCLQGAHSRMRWASKSWQKNKASMCHHAFAKT